MMRICQLRRSFSLDFVNDDAATVFHLHDQDHSQNAPIHSKPPSPYHGGPITHHQPNLHTSNHYPVNMSTAVHWQESADIEDALAADFDGSLSGLGMELGTSSFNMSEALLALPSLKAEHPFSAGSVGHSSLVTHHGHRHHKDQHPTDFSLGSGQGSASNSNQEDVRPVAIVHGKKNRLAYGHDEDSSVSSGTKRFCVNNQRDSLEGSDAIRYSVFALQNQNKDLEPECSHDECASDFRCHHRHSNSAPDLRTTAHVIPHSSSSSSPSPSSTPASVLTQILSVHSQYATNASTPSPEEPRSPHVMPRSWNQFQYILCASTSMATKLHEETMTYLNQGQSYEIKLKKLGDLTEMRGKKLRSAIKVGFHERRLQFMEKELISQWKGQRSAERILEIDIPLSYGISEIVHDPIDINKCYFSWEPTKETGIYVKVNCISTEFTPKKHGGEKGVPFRLIVETHSYTSPQAKVVPSSSLHAASCQVKVFKPKGADRKHKTDREKMSKRGQNEQGKFQASCDCTVFAECPVDTSPIAVVNSPPDTTAIELNSLSSTPTPVQLAFSPKHMIMRNTIGTNSLSLLDDEKDTIPLILEPSAVPTTLSETPERRHSTESITTNSSTTGIMSTSTTSLHAESSSIETVAWLRVNRLDTFAKIFANFSGADLLRLTREEAIEICGLADGIRLFNALHSRTIRPRLTFYVSKKSDELFRAIYLEMLQVKELAEKLSAVVVPAGFKISTVCLLGPSGIKVLMTDDVVQNLPQESMFIVELEKEPLKENAMQATLRQYK